MAHVDDGFLFFGGVQIIGLARCPSKDTHMNVLFSPLFSFFQPREVFYEFLHGPFGRCHHFESCARKGCVHSFLGRKTLTISC